MVKSNDERFLPFQKPKTYQYLDVESSHAWTAAKRHRTTEFTQLSDDQIEPIESEVLFGAFFFLSNKKIEHTHQVFTLMQLLIHFGGLFILIFAIFAFIGFMRNKYLYLGSLTDTMFVLEEPKEPSQAKRSRTSYCQIRYCFNRVFCRTGDSVAVFYKRQLLQQKRHENTCKELDVMNMVKTIQKLKAGLAAVINND